MSVATSYNTAHSTYAQSNAVNSKFIFSAHYGHPLLHHTFTGNLTFSHIFIHLVISAYLTQHEQDNLNICHLAYKHLVDMTSCVKLDIIYIN